ncbi:MAG TPA: DUF1735 domain-containing protein [Ferruginibacter sp.]|jgi:hypothetical protein|nr:DUF1735 domain-containing protein [Ferruginibacter sp.]
MKKTITLSTLLAAVVLLGAGCLKDKGYDDQEYQTQIKEIKGVAFPQAASSPIAGSLVSQTTPMVIDGPLITLEQDRAATSDVTVTLQVNQALVTADPSLGLSPLPNGTFSVAPLTVVIPAGSKFSDAVKITLNNTSLLDPTITYGVGLSIISATDGYKIASNQKDIVFAFTIRNKYDGIYRLKAYTNLGTTNTSAPYLVQTDCAYGLTLETLNANTVRLSNQPLWRAGAFFDGFCNVNVDISFNTATDKVSAVTNWTMCPPTGTVILFPATGTWPAQFNNQPSYDSRYDPATKTVFVAYNQASNARLIVDTLIYCGPRP